LAAPYFDKQRSVILNTLAKKFAIICCITTLLGTSATSLASAAQPDFSGVWIPDVRDQKRQETANMPPWKPEILPQIQHLISEEKAGRPFLVLSHCLPHGMPSWMLMTHNAFELLITPAASQCWAKSMATECGESIWMGVRIPKTPISRFTVTRSGIGMAKRW